MCTSLKQIIIPSLVNIIKSYAFDGRVSLTEVLIKGSLNNIDKCILRECSSLKYVSIPSSIQLIGDYAFSECHSLKQISIFSSKNHSSFTIPKPVQSIGDYAFSECSILSIPYIYIYLNFKHIY